jgi:hypothetical protein
MDAASTPSTLRVRYQGKEKLVSRRPSRIDKELADCLTLGIDIRFAVEQREYDALAIAA